MKRIGLGVMQVKAQVIFKFRRGFIFKKDIGIGNSIVYNIVRIGSINEFKVKMDIRLELIQLDTFVEQ